MLVIDSRWRHQQRRNRSVSRRTTHPAGLRRHEGAGALGYYSAALIEFTTSCTCEVGAPLPSRLVSWHNNCPTGELISFFKKSAACHPERSARNARVAKDLLCLWYRTAGPSLRKRRENQADQRSIGGQRRLLPRGEHEQQHGPQGGKGRADQQLAAFGGKLNRHQRHDRPMRDTGPDGVRDQAAICGGVACREHQENAEDPAPPE